MSQSRSGAWCRRSGNGARPTRPACSAAGSRGRRAPRRATTPRGSGADNGYSRLPPEVDELDGRAAARRCGSGSSRRSSRFQLSTRGVAPRNGDSPLQRGSLRGHRSRVVARIRLLLERPVVLLVDNDEPEPLDRSEDRRPCSDHDTCRARRDPLALVTALRVAQRRVEHGDPVTEALTEATDGLRRQGDLGHENDDPSVALERRRRTPGGTPPSSRSRSGRARGRAPPASSAAHDASYGVLWPCVSWSGSALRQRVAGGRLGGSHHGGGRGAARRVRARGQAWSRSSPRARARARRAAPGRDRRRRRRRRPRRPRGGDARSTTTPRNLRAPSRIESTSPCSDVVGDAVCERARQRARRHQRIDLRERHSPSVRRVYVVRRRRRRARSPYQSRGRGRAGLRRA